MKSTIGTFSWTPDLSAAVDEAVAACNSLGDAEFNRSSYIRAALKARLREDGETVEQYRRSKAGDMSVSCQTAH